jgi:hypothetical protein
MTSLIEMDDLLSNEQAARILGVKKNTLEIWRHKGKGPPFIKLGEHPSSPIRYQRSRVIAWVEARTFSSTSAATVSQRGSAHNS